MRHVCENKWLWLIGFALVYCVGVNERESSKSGMEMFQSNMYYYVRIKKVYCACTRFLCMHKILVHAQHSCACTRVLCIHKSVAHAQNIVHAQESYGPTAAKWLSSITHASK